MAECCSRCIQFCFGRKSDVYPKTEILENQAIKTVRRISSVGQTFIDENGEEKEIPRHSNILKSFNDTPVPWTSTPLTIQPGVSKEEVINRIKALPTIIETPPKQKKGWKKALSKKDNYSFKSKEKIEESVQLKLFTQLHNLSKSTEVIPGLNLNSSQNLRRGSYGSSPNLSTVESLSEGDTSVSNYTLTSSVNSDKLLLPITNHWALTQSMENLNKTMTSAEMAKKYGLDISMYTEPLDYPLYNQNSSSEIENLYIPKSEGKIELLVSFHESEKLLTVFISQIKDLSGVGPSKEAYSPTLKLCIQGEKKQVKNEKKISPNLNPSVNQYFTFYLKEIKDAKMLRISIFNSNFMGRHDAVGHGHLCLKKIQEEQSSTVKIQRPSSISSCPALLEMMFLYDRVFFHLNLNRVFNLASKYKKCKLHLRFAHYCQTKKVKEKVTTLPHFEGETDEIVLNQMVKFKIDPSGFKHDFVLISIKSADQSIFKKTDKTIGRLFLGPSFYYDDNSLTPWGRAILHEEKINHAFKMYL